MIEINRNVRNFFDDDAFSFALLLNGGKRLVQLQNGKKRNLMVRLGMRSGEGADFLTSSGLRLRSVKFKPPFKNFDLSPHLIFSYRKVNSKKFMTGRNFSIKRQQLAARRQPKASSPPVFGV